MSDSPALIADTIRAKYELYGDDAKGYGGHHKATKKPIKAFKTAAEREKHLEKAVAKSEKARAKTAAIPVNKRKSIIDEIAEKYKDVE